MAKKKDRFETVKVPDGKGGFESRKIPKKMTLEEEIIQKIRQRAPKKKAIGGIMKASAGKMTESDLQKKVDRDARINKARKSIKKQKEKDPFQISRAQREMQRRISGRGREMRRIGKATGVAALGPIGAITDREMKQRMQGMSKGGMCRGMGAAVRGGSFKGVK